MQTEARIGVMVEGSGGQRPLADGGVYNYHPTSWSPAAAFQQSQIGTVSQLLAGGVVGPCGRLVLRRSADSLFSSRTQFLPIQLVEHNDGENDAKNSDQDQDSDFSKSPFSDYLKALNLTVGKKVVRLKGERDIKEDM